MWLIPTTSSHNIVEAVPRGGEAPKAALVKIQSTAEFVDSFNLPSYFLYRLIFPYNVQVLSDSTTSFFNWSEGLIFVQGFQRLSFLGLSPSQTFRYRRILTINSNVFQIPPNSTIISPLNFRYHFIDAYGIENSVIELTDPVYQTNIYPNTIEIDIEATYFLVPMAKVFKYKKVSPTTQIIVFKNDVFTRNIGTNFRDKTFTLHNNQTFLWQTL